LKGQGGNHTQINGNDRLRVVSQVMSSSFATAAHPAPCISRRWTGRPRSQASAVRHGSEMLPLWVFLAHPSDEITQATIDLWPPRPLSRLPAPERFPARAMPPEDSLRLNDLGRAEQARPGGKDSERRAMLAYSRRSEQRGAEIPPNGHGRLRFA